MEASGRARGAGRWRLLAGVLPLAAAGLLAATAAAGEGQDEDPAPPDPPALPLEELLRLPESFDVRYEDPRRGGATRSEWQGRFRDAHEALEAARTALSSAQKELEKTAASTSQWQVAAPGQSASAETSPVSFRLTQEIRRAREDVERSEHRLQDLVVQANLAGVPETWRE